MLGDRASPLTLSLLQPRILLVDDVTLALADHDLAIRGFTSNTAFDFHAITRSSCMPSLSVDNSAFRHVIGAQLDLDLVPWKNPDVELSHPTADVGKDLLPILQLDFESSIWQRLGHNGIQGDLFFFGHALPGISESILFPFEPSHLNPGTRCNYASTGWLRSSG